MVPPHPSVIARRYRIDALVGSTASRVHRAHDLLLQRDVAIKSFPGDDGPLRWRRDGRLRERLGTGQAMEVLDGDPDGEDGPFVVMPLARDGSLDRIEAAWEPWPAAVLVARLAVGLRRLHGLGAVHGAVAADAVLLDPQHGPRWTGHGGVPPEGATAEDDVRAFARLATAAVADLAAAAEVSDEVVDAVRALVRGPADVAGLERVRAGLAAEVARRAARPSTIPVAVPVPAGARAGRLRRTVLAACTAAAVAGGVVGVGAGVGGDDGATAAAADVAGAIPVLAAPVVADDGALPPAGPLRDARSVTTQATAGASDRAPVRPADVDASATSTARDEPRPERGGRLAERETTAAAPDDADEAGDRGDDAGRGGGTGGGGDDRDGASGEDAGRGSDEGAGEDSGADAGDGSGDPDDSGGGSEDGFEDGSDGGSGGPAAGRAAAPAAAGTARTGARRSDPDARRPASPSGARAVSGAGSLGAVRPA